MNIDDAETILRDYRQVLEEEGKLGARRSPALLPTSKQQILDAIRILTAQLYYQGLDDEESLRPLVQAAMFLDSFTNDALDSLRFVEGMQTRRREISEFHQELHSIQRNDRYFWQRVYALAGISTETKGSTIFERIKASLSRAVCHEARADAVYA